MGVNVPFIVTNVAVVYGTAPITGFADGQKLNVEFDNDNVSVHSGGGGPGNYRFIVDPRETGKITLRLTDYSPSNLALTLAYRSRVPSTFIISDPSSNGTLFSTPAAMVQKMVPLQFDTTEAIMNEWVLVFGESQYVQAGAREII